MDDELVSQVITPEEEAKELNTQAKVRLAEKGIIAKSYVEEEQERENRSGNMKNPMIAFRVAMDAKSIRRHVST